MRTPQGISAARVKAFTPENVAKFFDIYEPLLTKVNHNPHRVYNVDETGITTVQHKYRTVIGMKGKKQVASLTSSERGNLIRIVTCMNAAGTYVPPLFVKPSADDPALLILDGHFSHTKNIDVVDKARENHVDVICLPPHLTHKMQPLDVGFMGPFKTYYANEIETWLASNPGHESSLIC
ncbi:hypothetical protein ANN_20599 [Periplaneta americana]|uniref:DDE-1 domain-containing protein n=1 Tax=Periplaneta americana TaxID=6978 RepID=A0ABQ8SDU4_PERAM|nr:hypothetical protein ANN_20599 [Periplaneta americana]